MDDGTPTTSSGTSSSRIGNPTYVAVKDGRVTFLDDEQIKNATVKVRHLRKDKGLAAHPLQHIGLRYENDSAVPGRPLSRINELQLRAAYLEV